MIRTFTIFACMITASISVAADVQVSDEVLAYWEEGKAYFVGTVVEKKESGYLILFEDGDTAVVAKAKVRKNDIKVGSDVFARWTDGKFYKGKVVKIVGRALFVHYADGEQRWVPWSWIAIE